MAVAFRGRPRTLSFGEPTAGLSSANQTFPLSDGAQLFLTTALLADRTGRAYGGSLVPDVPVATAPEAPGRGRNVASRDAALAAALGWLATEPECRTRSRVSRGRS
jgi:C-terminal processing protease CtpA/Prc